MSGIGCTIVEATGVSPQGRISISCTGIYNDEHVEARKPITALYRDQGISVLMQINHAGGKASTMRPWGPHGYLLHSFMSPWSNQRTDEYGGTLQGRMRLPIEVARAVRDAQELRHPEPASILQMLYAFYLRISAWILP